MLTQTSAQTRKVGDERTGCSVARRVQPTLRRADPQRGTLAIAGRVQGAARSPDDQFASRPAGLGALGAERSNRDMDQPGIDLGEIRKGQTSGGHHTRCLGLDEKVSLGHQPQEQVAIGGQIQIAGQASLGGGVG